MIYFCSFGGIGRHAWLKSKFRKEYRFKSDKEHFRDVTQFGRVLALGARCRRFESCHLDLEFLIDTLIWLKLHPMGVDDLRDIVGKEVSPMQR